MTAPREEWQLDTRRLGRRVLVFDRLDSTNTRATRLADEGATEGVAVLADEQTAGRGQHGRSWLATPGDAVLLSLLLSPPPPLRRPAVLTAWAAVSVCAVVSEVTGLQARIKWPNDVLLRGRKVCGILIEQGRGRGGLITVVGIGLNVRQGPGVFAAAGLPDATSLAAACPTPPDTAETARRLVRRLDEEYGQLCDGDLGTLEACWAWHLGLLGREVAAECADATYHGRLCRVSFAAVELEQLGDGLLVLQPERVQHLQVAE
jgi:BirA family biotin operon repressor/biotin-[acetyl-CoA-carboxylase] ligase